MIIIQLILMIVELIICTGSLICAIIQCKSKRNKRDKNSSEDKNNNKDTNDK